MKKIYAHTYLIIELGNNIRKWCPVIVLHLLQVYQRNVGPEVGGNNIVGIPTCQPKILIEYMAEAIIS